MLTDILRNRLEAGVQHHHYLQITTDGFEQVALIAFEGTQVMVLGIENQLTSFFWVLMASKAITTPLRASCLMNAGKALISLVLRST